MSYAAALYFKSRRSHSNAAPGSVYPKGKFTFGQNFPRMIDLLDQSARELGVPEPSRFIWHDPLDDEGELDKLSSEEFEVIRRKHNGTMFWIPIEIGIKTFASLALRHKLSLRGGNLTEQEYYIAFEIACFQNALQDAVAEGEEAFHIQCF